MSAPVRIGINGFGRIGRCATRLALDHPGLELVAVNDLAGDVANLVYLYNYDSTHGRAPRRAEAQADRRRMLVDGRAIPFYAEAAADAVPWDAHGVEILVDATGIADNVAAANRMVEAGVVRKAILTHSPDGGVDRYLIMGVNDADYDAARDHVVSCTICDANAIAHPLAALERGFGIESGFVTTLHPWLSYQNLVDAPVAWQSRPGRFWTDFSLGRMSTGTLIPKSTTAVTTLGPVMPRVAKRLSGFSYRTPTHIVSSADLVLRLEADVTRDSLDRFLREAFAGSPYVAINDESLIGIDYVGSPHSAVIDAQWLQVVDGRMVKVVLWYDNEWGYASRVIDTVDLLAGRRGAAREAAE